MKKLSFVLFISLCFVSFAAAQDIDKLPTITVTGTADIETAPDEVTFSLDVNKTDMDLQTAKRLSDETVGKILELTRRFQVKPQNVKTNAISVEMKYETIRDPKKKIYDEDGDEIGKRIFKGYEISKTVIVKLTDIARFEEFFEEALKTGITEVGKVSFETSKYREMRIEAREMAMKAARDKAAAMTAAVNQTIGKAIYIQEGIPSGDFTNGIGISANGNRGRSNNFKLDGQDNNDNKVIGSGSVTTTFAPGSIKVSSSVTIVFVLN